MRAVNGNDIHNSAASRILNGSVSVYTCIAHSFHIYWIFISWLRRKLCVSYLTCQSNGNMEHMFIFWRHATFMNCMVLHFTVTGVLVMSNIMVFHSCSRK